MPKGALEYRQQQFPFKVKNARKTLCRQLPLSLVLCMQSSFLVRAACNWRTLFLACTHFIGIFYHIRHPILLSQAVFKWAFFILSSPWCVNHLPSPSRNTHNIACLCVCVCVCMCACERVSVCVCVCVCDQYLSRHLGTF
jgi:hypothetical protein